MADEEKEVNNEETENKNETENETEVKDTDNTETDSIENLKSQLTTALLHNSELEQKCNELTASLNQMNKDFINGPAQRNTDKDYDNYLEDIQ